MISEPTEVQITEALESAARPRNFGEEGWRFTPSGAWHSEKSARMIARMCLILDVPVSDIFSVRFCSTIVDRIVAIEKRLDEGLTNS